MTKVQIHCRKKDFFHKMPLILRNNNTCVGSDHSNVTAESSVAPVLWISLSDKT